MSRPVDLEAEMQSALDAVTGRHLATLEKLGCKPAAIAAIGANQAPFGVAKCDMRGVRFFEPSAEPYGIDAVVMPVIADGVIIDNIAWRTLAPDAWLLRTGDGWVLGEDLITSPSLWDGFREITLHATPLDWLRAAGEGAVVLDWTAPEHIRKLAMFDVIHAVDIRVRQQLTDILIKPERMPKIIAGARHGSKAA